jgi:hypothetical protein
MLALHATFRPLFIELGDPTFGCASVRECTLTMLPSSSIFVK